MASLVAHSWRGGECCATTATCPRRPFSSCSSGCCVTASGAAHYSAPSDPVLPPPSLSSTTDEQRRHCHLACSAAAARRTPLCRAQYAAAEATRRDRVRQQPLPAPRRSARRLAHRDRHRGAENRRHRVAATWALHPVAGSAAMDHCHARRVLDDANHLPAYRPARPPRTLPLPAPSQLSCGHRRNRAPPPRLRRLADCARLFAAQFRAARLAQAGGGCSTFAAPQPRRLTRTGMIRNWLQPIHRTAIFAALLFGVAMGLARAEPAVATALVLA